MVSDEEFQALKMEVEELKARMRGLQQLLGSTRPSQERRKKLKITRETGRSLLKRIMLPQNEIQEVIDGKKSYVLIFSKKGCGVCARFNVQMAELVNELDLAQIRYVDANDLIYRTLKNHFRITGLPTVIVANKGKAIEAKSHVQAISLLPRKK